MKKIVNYIVATLLLVSGYTTVNAQYNEGGGGFIFTPTPTPTRPVSTSPTTTPKPKPVVTVPTEKMFFKPLTIQYSKLSIVDFPSARTNSVDLRPFRGSKVLSKECCGEGVSRETNSPAIINPGGGIRIPIFTTTVGGSQNQNGQSTGQITIPGIRVEGGSIPITKSGEITFEITSSPSLSLPASAREIDDIVANSANKSDLEFAKSEFFKNRTSAIGVSDLAGPAINEIRDNILSFKGVLPANILNSIENKNRRLEFFEITRIYDHYLKLYNGWQAEEAKLERELERQKQAIARALKNPNIYKYSFGRNNNPISENANEKKLVALIDKLIDGGDGVTISTRNRKFENLLEGTNLYAGTRTSLILRNLEDDLRWEITQNIDNNRQAILDINDELKGLNSNSSRFTTLNNQKKNYFNKIREDFKVLNGLQIYNRTSIANDLFVSQTKLFFGTAIDNEDRLNEVLDRVSRADKSNQVGYGWETTEKNRDKIREEATKSGTNQISSNENIDYGLLKLEFGNKFNAGVIDSGAIDFINDQKNDIINYLNANDNSKAAAFCMRYLFDKWSSNESFVTNTSRYKSNTTPRFQSASNPNLAISTKLTTAAINDGYVGFSNIMESFFDNINGPTDKMYEFEGKIIGDIFKANNLGGITNANLNDSRFLINIGESFNFSNVTNGLGLDIVFSNDIGNTLLDKNINTNLFLDKLNQEDNLKIDELVVPEWLLDLLESNFPRVLEGFRSVVGEKGNNFSLKKLLTWAKGNSDYIDGYRKTKGIVGEGLIFTQSLENHPTSNVRWHSNKTTTDILIEGTAGFDMFTRETKFIHYEHNDLDGLKVRERITEGNVALLIEVKTLGINRNNSFLVDNLVDNMENAFNQVLKQREEFKIKNQNVENVISILAVDQEIIDTILAENVGVTKDLFISLFDDFKKSGGRLNTFSGLNSTRTNLNGRADQITLDLYNSIRAACN